jgi:Phosphopantetheine attachment site/AMP-binding enzyme
VDETCYECPREGDIHVVPIGRPISNTQVYVLDRNQSPSPIGVPGELHIAGHGLARGYWNQPDLTREKFVPNPFQPTPGARMYRSGDIVRYRPDGQVEFLGRRDEQVKIRGVRIELGEVEAALKKHPEIIGAIAAVRNTRLIASAHARSAVSNSEIRGFLEKKLPRAMLPSKIVWMNALPLLPNGKVNRRALPDPESPGPDREEFILPSDDVESQLAVIWQDLLALPPVSVRSNFFEIGGHSLLMAKMLRRIERSFGKKLSMPILFQAPTIEPCGGCRMTFAGYGANFLSLTTQA